MEKRIELEKRGRPAEEIVDLNLDNCRATQIDGLTDEFKNLESLSLINVGLTTLKGFPNLPNLRKLELSDNRISGSLNLLSGCPRLQYLNLSGNKIKDIEPLEPLQKDFQELRNLDLFNCEVTSLDKYREKVFELLTTVQYLDGYDRENKEEIDDDEEDEDGDAEEIDDEEDGDDDDDDDDGDDIVDIDDDDDDDDLDEDDDDDEAEVEGEVGLSYLENDDLDGDEDGEDFEPEDDDDDDDLPDDEDDEAGDDESRGVKRKHEDEEADN